MVESPNVTRMDGNRTRDSVSSAFEVKSLRASKSCLTGKHPPQRDRARKGIFVYFRAVKVCFDVLCQMGLEVDPLE